MVRCGRPKAKLVLTDEEREQLLRWSRRRRSSQALALRSRIVLACAGGTDNKVVAAQLGCAAATVGKWRARFIEHRLDGLSDEPRPGRPPSITAEQVEDVVVATLESTPTGATHWSRAKMAERTGLSRSSIGRIWKAFELKPHRTDGFKLSNDPLLVEKVYDIVALYLDPPENAVVLSVDEKSQVQALARSQPAFPMMPGMPEKRAHDYIRHGTTSLFAALNVADGTVIASTRRRHRASEFKKFLTKIEDQVPAHLDVHVGLRQLRHPQAPEHQEVAGVPPTVHDALHPYVLLLDQPGRAILRRGHPRAAATLGPPLGPSAGERSPQLGQHLERDPKPLIWTKTADQILASLGRLLQRTTGAGH